MNEINKSEKKSASLTYSGGSDSTLSATILAKDYSEIHLITFKHYGTWGVGKSRINAQKLREKYPDVVFKHVFLNSTKLFLRIQSEFLSDIRDFPYFTLYACGACKLAMHTQTILYNLKNNIPVAASGASHTMELFPDQTVGGIKTLEKFYGGYGIQFLNPVFTENEADKKASSLGVLDPKHLKDTHKWKTPIDVAVAFRNVVDNIQGFCLLMQLVKVDHLLLRDKDPKRISDLSSAYYSRKIISICKKYIDSRYNPSVKH